MGNDVASNSCCGNSVTLSDLVGKPIEFRRYGKLAPFIGTKWECPGCSTSYFISWHRESMFWEDILDSKEQYLFDSIGQSYYNDYKDKFVYMNKLGKLKDTGYFLLSLNYYDKLWKDDPWDYCEEADDVQLINYFSDFLLNN